MKTEYVERPDLQSDAGRREIERAGEIIRRGGLVVFPTETVFGLGGNGLDAEAAAKIYAAKGRPSDNPLIIHIAEPSDAKKYTETTDLFDRLALRFMPGPLTVVLPAKPIVPKTVTAGLPTVAVRCPSHPVAHALIAAAGVPIAAPSANLSGSPSPTTFSHVREDLDGRVDMILGGECEIGVESTIVRLDSPSSLTLLRPGGITPEQLGEFARVTLSDAVLNKLKEGETVQSPGMKYKHYAPKTPLFLLRGDLQSRIAYLSRQTGRFAVLAGGAEIEVLSRHPASPVLFDFGDDPAIRLHRLFFLLREADKAGCERIYAALPETEGLSLALYNRMIRAAGYQIIETN